MQRFKSVHRHLQSTFKTAITFFGEQSIDFDLVYGGFRRILWLTCYVVEDRLSWKLNLMKTKRDYMIVIGNFLKITCIHKRLQRHTTRGLKHALYKCCQLPTKFLFL